VHDPSLGANEIKTPLELVASRQRKHTSQSIGRELPELIDRFCAPCVDHAMSAELSDQTCRRSA